MVNKQEKEKPVVEMLSISQLKISDFNVRKEHDEPEKISELAKSIQENGILQPLLVRPENGQYGIIIGSRRYSAAKKAHLKELPVTIKQIGDQESLIISLIENLQRNDLEPIETTQALNKLNETLSTRDLAEKIGKSQTYISNMVTVEQLLFKLDQAGVKTEMHPKEVDIRKEKAIPLYHAVFVAEAFNSKELKPVKEKEPDKDLEVAKAVMHSTHEHVKQIMKEYRKHPNDNINYIVERADMGEFDRQDRSEGGHAEDYLGGRGSEDIDIANYEFMINHYTARLARYLTNIPNMPEPSDDVEVDFIRKSRDFRKLLVSEMQPHEANGIHSRLNYLSKLVEEMLDEIEKVHQK